MKTIKLTIIALIVACSFQVANAQVSVGLRVGTPPPRHRTVVVERRPVVVQRRHVIVRPAPRRVAYYRHGHRYYRTVTVRHY